MDFEKTIMELLKKYVDEQKDKDLKTEGNAQNAEIIEDESENFAKNSETDSVKTENDVLPQEEKEEVKSEILEDAIGEHNEKQEDETQEVETETEPEKTETEQATNKQLNSEKSSDEDFSEKNESINTDPDAEPTYKNTIPSSWSETEKLLNIVENSYSEVLPEQVEADEVPTFERKPVDETTAEEIEEAAKEKIDSLKEVEESKIVQNFEQKEEAQESQKKTAQSKYQSGVDEINTAYNAARVKTENDALKRGIARSSIVCLKLEEIEKDRASELKEEGQKLQDTLNSIENELAKLESDKASSLDNLNVSYAVKLQEEIDKKMKELVKSQNAALEYNNKVAELEYKYKLKADTTTEERQKAAEEKAKIANQKQQKAKENEQVALLTNYFSSFDTEKAISELKKHSEIASRYGVDVYYRVYRNLINK